MSTNTEEITHPTYEAIKPIADPSQEKTGNDRRSISLMTPASGRKALYLQLLDSEHSSYSPLLGFATTCKRDELADKQDNVVVPIIPRCYTTPDRNPALADNPRKGWIYIMRRRPGKDGGTVCELWRELWSNGMGSYSDVNWAEIRKLKEQKKAGKEVNLDQRKATGQAGFRIVVPYQIDNGVHQLWIAFSEVQWSWARIEQLRTDHDLREKRMHKLDLSDSLQNFENSLCNLLLGKTWHALDAMNPNDWKDVTGPAKFYTLDSAPDTASKSLPDDFKEAIPVVYLDDPVGIGRNLAKRYQAQCGLMIDKVKEIESQETDALKNKNYTPVRWLKSAKLLNGILTARTTRPKSLQELEAEEQQLKQEFEQKREELCLSVDELMTHIQSNDELRAKYARHQSLRQQMKQKREELHVVEDKVEDEQDRYEDHLEHLEDLKSNVDLAKLEQALGTKEREELRPGLIQFKQDLVDFLSVELLSQEETPMQLALDDHFSLPASRNWEWYEALQGNRPEPDVKWPNAYADGWKAVSDLIQLLDKHQFDFDHEFIGDFDSWTLRRNDKGIGLLIQLADPQTALPIQQRLFPAETGTNPCAVGPKGSLLQSFDSQKLVGQSGEDLKDTANIFDRFFKPFEEVIALRDRHIEAFEKSINNIKPHLTRLVNGITGLSIEPVRTNSDDVLTYYQTAEKSIWPIEQKALILLGSTANAYFTDQVSADETGLKTTEIDQVVDTNGPGLTKIEAASESGYVLKEVQIRTTEASANAGFSATAANGEKIPLNATTSGSKRPKTGSRRYHITAFMSLDDAGQKNLLARMGKNQQNIKAVTSLLGIVEIINVVNCLQSISNSPTKKKDWTTYAGLLQNVCTMFSAVGEAAEVAEAGVFKSRMDKLVVNAAMQNTQKLSWFKISAHIGNTLELGLTFKSMLDNIEQGDDAAQGDALACAGILANGMFANAVAPSVAAALGLTVGLVGTVITVSIALAIAAVRYFFFQESTYLELWIKNGPFSAKEEPFMGHIPGTPTNKIITSYVQVAGTNQKVAQFQTITGSALRYAVWCETPEEAYRALMDAIYRPVIAVKEVLLNQISVLQIRVGLPCDLPDSKISIRLKRWESGYAEYSRDVYWQKKLVAEHPTVEQTITYEDSLLKKEDKNNNTSATPADEKEKVSANTTYEPRRPLSDWTHDKNVYGFDIQNHHETKLTVMVRLDVNGDGSFVIPYEPAFNDDVDTVTEKDKEEHEATERWLIHSGLYDKPRNMVHNGDKRVIYDAHSADM